MSRFGYAISCATTVAPFVAALPSAAASSPLADPAYGGNGDGIARVPATFVPMQMAYGKHAVLQVGGKLVMIGDARRYIVDHHESQRVFARLDAGGQLDATLGTDHDGLVKADGDLDPRFGAGGVFLQADPGSPQTVNVDSQQQFLAGDHLHMIGSTLDADGHYGLAATRRDAPVHKQLRVAR